MVVGAVVGSLQVRRTRSLSRVSRRWLASAGRRRRAGPVHPYGENETQQGGQYNVATDFHDPTIMLGTSMNH